MKGSEKDQQQIEEKVKSLHEELQKAQTSSAKQQAEEKELQARLLNEVEERERAHQEAHQLKKQVRCIPFFLFFLRFLLNFMPLL